MKITAFANASRHRRWMARGSVVLLATLCAALVFFVGDVSQAQEPVSSKAIAQTIRQLGAKSFIDREDATQRLISLGASAEPQLIQATDSADREVRRRSVRVLRLVRRQQRDVLLAKFRTDPEWEPGDQLPGWKIFAKRYTDPQAATAARATYADILESEWELVEKSFNAEEDFQRRNALLTRYHELSKQGLSYHNCETGTALAFFFLCSEHPDEDRFGGGLQRNLFNYFRNPGVLSMLTRRTNASREQQDVVRSLVSDWLISSSEPSLNDRNARSALHHANIYQLKKAGQLVTERILRDPKSLPTTKSNAMQSAVLRDDKSQIGLIEPFLEDQTPLGTSNKRVKQLRDIALACVMKLNDYPLDQIGVKLSNSGVLIAFNYQTLGFITDGDRKKAFDTYRKLHAAKQKKQP